jgi:hypothetical protein
MKTLTDKQVKNKGLRVLFRELGEADAIRFLSQISTEKRDYLSLQDELFKGMNVDEIFEKAKKYSERRSSEAL